MYIWSPALLYTSWFRCHVHKAWVSFFTCDSRTTSLLFIHITETKLLKNKPKYMNLLSLGTIQGSKLDNRLNNKGIWETIPPRYHGRSYSLYMHCTLAVDPSRTCLQRGLSWNWKHRSHPWIHREWSTGLGSCQAHRHGQPPSFPGYLHLPPLCVRVHRGPACSYRRGLIFRMHEPGNTRSR